MKILSIDIGGTFIKYAVMTCGEFSAQRGKVPTPMESREALVEAIGELYDHYDPDGIAVSLPGIIDAERGIVIMGGALRYNNGFALRNAIQARCPVPVTLENDAKCAAMAEAHKGSLQDVESGFVLIFGTMVGGGYVRAGELVRGFHHSAGEVSYIIMDREARPEGANIFGNRCGTPYLCGLYAERMGLDAASVDGERVFRAANDGEPQAIEALDIFARSVAAEIFSLQTVLDPQRFAIGGGISEQPIFLEFIQRNLDALYRDCPYPVPHAEIVPCRFRNDANLIGAYQCYLSAHTACEG